MQYEGFMHHAVASDCQTSDMVEQSCKWVNTADLVAFQMGPCRSEPGLPNTQS